MCVQKCSTVGSDAPVALAAPSNHRCNPDDSMLATLASLGAGFDCASQNEIDRVGVGSIALMGQGSQLYSNLIGGKRGAL